MTDHELWALAIERVKADYDLLPLNLKHRVVELSKEILSLKGRHQAILSTTGTEGICGACKGICCRFGKHHFTVVDLLVYLSSERELFTPSFDNHVCPYHNGAGCLMEPSFRPFNCIIFICEELENRLGSEDKEELAIIEARLRMVYGEYDRILGNRFVNGLLITCQRAIDAGLTIFSV